MQKSFECSILWRKRKANAILQPQDTGFNLLLFNLKLIPTVRPHGVLLIRRIVIQVINKFHYERRTKRYVSSFFPLTEGRGKREGHPCGLTYIAVVYHTYKTMPQLSKTRNSVFFCLSVSFLQIHDDNLNIQNCYFWHKIYKYL